MEEGEEQEEAGEPSDCNAGLIPVKGGGQEDWGGGASHCRAKANGKAQSEARPPPRGPSPGKDHQALVQHGA